MEHKRRRFQFGWLNLKARRNGPGVWVLRYRETLANGRKRTPSVIIGTVKEYPSEALARKASMSYILTMNALFPRQRRWESAASAGTHSGIAIPHCFTRLESI